jgi:hypothetical protein
LLGNSPFTAMDGSKSYSDATEVGESDIPVSIPIVRKRQNSQPTTRVFLYDLQLVLYYWFCQFRFALSSGSAHLEQQSELRQGYGQAHFYVLRAPI